MALSGISASAPGDMFASMSSTAYTKKAKAQDTTSSSGTTASSGISTSAGSIGTTFLNLLVQELQNQDPTAPMDSTAMVGQMISLNQLNQLVSINQDLTPTTTTSTSSSSSGSTTGYASPVAGAATSSQSLNALSAAAANASNASTPLDLSTFSHIYGGK